MSDDSHIHPEFRHVLALPKHERIRFLQEPRWIGYRSAVDVVERLTGLLGTPKRLRMPNVLLVGDSNNGKSTIVHRLLQTCGEPTQASDGRSIIPIVVAEASKADEKSIYLAILDSFLDPHQATDTVSKLRYQVLYLFRTCSVRMLVIDEFHSMLTGSKIAQRETINALKFLCNQLKIPIVGVGTAKAMQLLHHDEQHAKRFKVLKLPLWKPDAEFQRLIASFEILLPLHNPSTIHQRDCVRLIHASTQGNLGDVRDLLVDCATDAIHSGKECIDKDIIESNVWTRDNRGIQVLTV